MFISNVLWKRLISSLYHCNEMSLFWKSSHHFNHQHGNKDRKCHSPKKRISAKGIKDSKHLTTMHFKKAGFPRFLSIYSWMILDSMILEITTDVARIQSSKHSSKICKNWTNLNKLSICLQTSSSPMLVKGQDEPFFKERHNWYLNG